MKLGQARGAAIVAGVAAGLSVAEYAARSVKQSVVGSGAAGKDQVQHMITRLLKLPSAPSRMPQTHLQWRYATRKQCAPRPGCPRMFIAPEGGINNMASPVREGCKVIGRIHGTLLERKAPELLIDVQGVGYEVLVSLNTFLICRYRGRR